LPLSWEVTNDQLGQGSFPLSSDHHEAPFWLWVVDRAEVVVPTVEQITTPASGVPARYRALVVLLAGSGLRIGEALGLGKSDVDFLRRTVKVKRQRLPSGVIGPPKTSKSARTVPLGKVVVDELAAHVANNPSEDALFTVPAGPPLGYSVWRHTWTKVDTTAKSRRRHAPIAAPPCVGAHLGRASVKVIQARLGHPSAVITLDTYGHLWPDDDTLTRTVIDAAFGPLEDSLRTKAALRLLRRRSETTQPDRRL
jgi:integrase